MHSHIETVECTTCTFLLTVEFIFQSLQLGILNVLEAMQLASEIVYPIYLAGASDRYFHFRNRFTMYRDGYDQQLLITVLI
jgi:hypothetical protein